MSKNLFVGVDGKAHRIVKAYIGDENGKARPFWENEGNIAENSLEFVSDNSFTMEATKTWNGTLSYNNGNGWTIWNGSQISSGNIDGRQRIYFRGSRNSYIRGQNASSNNAWKITGSNVECNGNIECLLDYQKVAAGIHPAMGRNCYKEMFSNCSSLTTAPELPATTLEYNCYDSMFYKCSSLTSAPVLPATTLEYYCYNRMFAYCSSLTTAPELPATTLAKACYEFMFKDCSSLTSAPALPATTLYERCYGNMFANCKNLTTAPALPATTLAFGCYESMFKGCFRLRKIPALPAHILPDYCYYGMFKECDIYLYSSGDETKNVIYLLPSERKQWTNTQIETNSLTDMFTYDGLIQTPRFPAGYRLDNYYSIIS